MPSSHLILCRPLLLLPPIPPSISLLQWVNSSHEVAKVLEFQLQHQISFRIDWLDLLAVQGTLKNLLQNHSSKASMLWCSAFFIVQLWHPYMTIGKTIALTRQTFVDKVMSLLFNMLSTFSSKEQASFNFMAAVTICSDFGAPQNKISHCFPIYLPLSDGTGWHDLSFLNVEL